MSDPKDLEMDKTPHIRNDLHINGYLRWLIYRVEGKELTKQPMQAEEQESEPASICDVMRVVGGPVVMTVVEELVQN